MHIKAGELRSILVRLPDDTDVLINIDGAQAHISETKYYEDSYLIVLKGYVCEAKRVAR